MANNAGEQPALSLLQDTISDNTGNLSYDIFCLLLFVVFIHKHISMRQYKVVRNEVHLKPSFDHAIQ